MTYTTPLVALAYIIPWENRYVSLSAKGIGEALKAEGVTVTEERLAMLLEYLLAGGMIERDQWDRYRQVRRVDW